MSIPEYYDENINIVNLKTNDLYHKLKPLRSELDRNSHLDLILLFIDSQFIKVNFNLIYGMLIQLLKQEIYN